MASKLRPRYNIWPYIRHFTGANPWKVEDRVLKLFSAVNRKQPWAGGVTAVNFPDSQSGKITFKFSWVENNNCPQVHSLELIGVVVEKLPWWSRFSGYHSLDGLLANIKAQDILVDGKSVVSTLVNLQLAERIE